MGANKAAVEGFAGGVGSLIALLTTYPLKTIYTLQAIRAVKARKGSVSREEALALLSSPARLVAALFHDIDWAGLYAGLGPAAVETATSSAVYFYFYSILRQAAVAANKRRRAAAGAAPGVRDEDIGVLASLGVAALAGAGNQLITTPLQVITTQMQANVKLRQGLAEAGRPADHIPTGVLGVSRQLLEEGGVAAFWKGLAPSLILVVNPAIQYALFERLTSTSLRLKEKRANGAAAALLAAGGGAVAPARAPRAAAPLKLGPGEVFLLGALAKIGATIVTYPMITIKARLQAMSKHTEEENRYGGTADAVHRIAAEEGLPGFFKGMGAKIVQTAINAALMLAIKDQVYDRTAAALNTLLSGVEVARSGAIQVPVVVVSR